MFEFWKMKINHRRNGAIHNDKQLIVVIELRMSIVPKRTFPIQWDDPFEFAMIQTKANFGRIGCSLKFP